MVAVIALTAVQFRFIERKVHYDGRAQRSCEEPASPFRPERRRGGVRLPDLFRADRSTHDAATIATGRMLLLPGGHLLDNYWHAITSGTGFRVSGTPVRILLINSLVMALVIAVGKIAISIISAYAVAFFELSGPHVLLLLDDLHYLDAPRRGADHPDLQGGDGSPHRQHLHRTHRAPDRPRPTATLLFRQVFATIPDELAEAAKIDGAGALRFFWQIVLPLCRTNIAALFVILFIYGWNQYLWPLLVTTDRSMESIVIGIVKMIGTSEAQTDWNLIMATAVLAMFPPVAVVVFLQHWFVKGLVETEK